MKHKFLFLVISLSLGAFLAPSLMPKPAEAGGTGHSVWVKRLKKKEREARLEYMRQHSKKKTAQKRNPRFDPKVQALRLRLFAGKELTPAQLKLLADKGESLAAVRYAQTILATAGSPDEALTYYSAALGKGRRNAVKPILAMLRAPALTLQRSAIDAAKVGLETAARKGNPEAAAGLAQLYLAGNPFGRNDEAALNLLISAGEHGDADAALMSALMLSRQGNAAAAREKSLKLFSIAAKKGNIVAISMLERLKTQE